MVPVDSNCNTITHSRIQSIDLARGLVMILMAIDHVRVYSGIPANGTDYGIFFTRWVTNFCAPAFVFLAGISIFLYAGSGRTRRELVRYLVFRGLLLVGLELTVIRFCWTFNWHYAEFTLAGIIWMLGCCMIGMAALTAFPPKVVGFIGIAIVAFQQLFGYLPGLFPVSAQKTIGYFWEFIYPSGLEGPRGIVILYVLVPWIGVMAMGYGFGNLFRLDAERRRRICLWTGILAILFYLVIGSMVILRQPPSDARAPFVLQLLNQRKYPASQLFLLMTLGPLVLAFPWAEKVSGRLAGILTTFGQVPFFFYLLHIPTIHIGAMMINEFREGISGGGWYGTAPYVFVPPEHRWSLGLLYLEWACDILFLYYLCRWYSRYKSSHPEKKWLTYL
jgi:uncharacterized membrane protein